MVLLILFAICSVLNLFAFIGCCINGDDGVLNKLTLALLFASLAINRYGDIHPHVYHFKEVTHYGVEPVTTIAHGDTVTTYNLTLEGLLD